MNKKQAEALLQRKAQEYIASRRDDLRDLLPPVGSPERARLISLLAEMYTAGGKAALETLKVWSEK